MIDWAQAGLIGGAGFATVLGVLLVLAVVVWLVGLAAKRFQRRGDKNEGQKG